MSVSVSRLRVRKSHPRRHWIPDGYVFFNRQPIIMEIGSPIMMI
jgi:hypothetical protein